MHAGISPWGQRQTPQEQTPPPLGPEADPLEETPLGVDPLEETSGSRPPQCSACLGDMGNMRPVRILLECILVF